MSDILIPLGKSKINYLDLRYVLRGIEKHVMNYDEIFIVGQKPDWIQGVVHLPFEDDPNPQWKERNIFRKIEHACKDKRLSDNFFMFNDDHFIIEDIDAENYPFYYKGTCYQSMVANQSFYRATMNHTRKLLERRGFEDINADTHTPIIYNKHEFLTTFEPEHWETKYGYGIKSIYCAFNKKPMTYMEDCKLGKRYTKKQVSDLVKDRHVFSCTDAPMKYGLGEWLEEKFPQKSSYEKQ